VSSRCPPVSVFVIFLGPGAGSRMAGGRGHHARNRRRHNRHPGHRPARGRDHLGPLGSRPPHRLAPAGCRAFLQRAVRSLAGEAGIRQIIDVGTGLPAAGNVHEVAAQIAPVTRVAYVDNDHCKSGCAHAGTTVAVPCCSAPVPGMPVARCRSEQRVARGTQHRT